MINFDKMITLILGISKSTESISLWGFYIPNKEKIDKMLKIKKLNK